MQVFFIIFSILIASFMGCPLPHVERADMSIKVVQPDWHVEGYWRYDELDQQSPYPFPIAHDVAWEGKEEFLLKLGNVESALRAAEHVAYYRGLSHSRLQPDEFVGSCEFQDPSAKIAWPCGYAEHYIGKFNVIPSRGFYDYVMQF